jgi:hypothetical protein
MDKGESL